MRRATAIRLVPALAAAGFLLAACAGEEAGIVASGAIEATEIRVSAQVSGRILETSAAEGATVKAGDVLARIDPEGYRLQVGQARAGAEAARAQFELLVGGARAEDILQGKAALDQAEEALRLADADAARMRGLAASGSATAKQRDDAESRLATAKAQREGAAQALRKLESFARPEELRAARARLEQAEWAVRIAEKSLADCAVLAPVPGTVLERLAEAGELALAGSGVATIADLGALSLTIFVPEAELGLVALGDEARVSVDSFPGRGFPGKVAFISPKAEFTPKNVQTRDERVKQVFAVRLDLGSGEGLLRPGMPADARLVPAAR